MLLPLLLTTAIAQQGVQHDFDGLTLKVPGPVASQKTVGKAKIWEGTRTMAIGGKEMVIGTYSVVVADMAGAARKPTDDQLIAAHELNMRGNKTIAAQNFRTSIGKFGDRKMVVLTGSIIAPDATKQPIPASFLSFGFIHGEKVYEYNQISFNFDLSDALENIRAMRIGTTAPADLPKDEKGDYTIAGVPFAVTSSKALRPLPNYPQDGFAARYSSSADDIGEVNRAYELAQLKPDDKRTDSEIFHALSTIRLLDGVPKDQFVVKDGSATLEVELKKGAANYKARLRYERVGNWVGVTVVSTLPSRSVLLGSMELKKLPAK